MKITIDNKVAGIVIFNPRTQKKLLKIFLELSKSRSLAEVPYNRLHLLRGKNYGSFALPVTNKARLLMVPIEYTENCTNIFCKKDIVGIEIVGITFNHYQKIKTKK